MRELGDHPGAVTMVTINQMNVICLGMGTGLQQLDHLPLEPLVGAIFYYIIGGLTNLDNSNAYVATNTLSRNAITITGGILPRLDTCN